MKSFLWGFLLSLVFSVSAMAQAIQVQGTVTEEATGLTLPGVSVYIEGTTTGTITNIDGQYTLDVPSDATIVYSFIGMKSIKEVVNGRTIIDVLMAPDSEQIEEVLAVGYAPSTKEAYTGAAKVVKADVIENRPVTSFEKALQGATAGLQVTSSSGQPGATAQVRIRGIGSLSAGSSPLYIVDGVPITGGISSINPNDIESTTVLKDAVSAAQYGSRAANGVIMITTKQGKAGKTNISFSAQTGVANRVSDGYPLMNSTQFYEHSWSGIYNFAIDNTPQEGDTGWDEYQNIDGGDPHLYGVRIAHRDVKDIVGYNPFSLEKPLNDNGKLIPGTTVNTNTDWRDQVYKTGIVQNYNLSMSGGTESTKVYFSLGYFDDNGTVLSSNFKRYSSKINVSHKVNSFITAGVNTLMSYSITNGPPSGSGGANPTRSADIINAASPVKVNGEWAWGNRAVLDFNPVALAEMDIYRSKGMRSMISSFLDISILPSLSFKTTGSVDYSHSKGLTYYNTEHGNGASVNGRSSMNSGEGYVWSLSNLLSWKKYSGLSSYKALLLQESTGTFSESMSAGVTDFAIPGKYDLVWGSQPSTPGSGSSESNLLSYLASFGYSYDGKYYGDINVRTDGSSRFGEDYKYGVFYSIGGGWIMTQEAWMKDISWLNFLKLRGSYGTAGNNNIGNYASLGLYSGGANYGGYPGLGASQPPNPNIHWESMTSTNIGVEATIFNNLSTTIELYEKKSDGLLYSRPLSSSKGFTSITTNLGAMKNYGIEAEFSYKKQIGAHITNTTGFNITANRNEILNLEQERLTGATQMREPGGDMHQFYMKEWAGVNPENGNPMWYTNVASDDEDNNAEPEGHFPHPNGSGRMVTSNYEDAERTRQGSAMPDFYGGLSNMMTYKNFDFNFNWYYSVGGQIYNYDYATNMHDGTKMGDNLSTDALDAWTPNNRYTDVPKYVQNNASGSNQISTRFLEDASYLRLKNIQLTYNLPQSICSKLKMQGLKVFVQAENLLTFTNFKGFDPEGALSGTTNNNIPGVKTYTFGIKMNM
ncbi:SusC/RagA family TonB-linked outer membrane protein [Carboxylicivirga marina]|uniref:TonB-dependent receptor n=1 Tax=Carboxylicivirga marina TaxID=2800988 RepID=A0ABS1HFQ9_9BACT|nr:TonB-dependent receptor [Carboxylicivirga marina]MBK3516476.1 TonB-dependent receptor [Carboxylicivirga marina]